VEDIMRRLAFLTPLAAALAFAAAAHADPATVRVTLGPDVQHKADDLGAREVQQQADRLAQVVERELARRDALDGARIELVLTDLKPNRPTMEQVSDRPGLDPIRSLSIGGAAIEGQITTASGEVLPVRYDWYTTTLSDARGYTTWQDAERAYQRLASNLAAGRYVSR
jgi:hypothetical protein